MILTGFVTLIGAALSGVGIWLLLQRSVSQWYLIGGAISVSLGAIALVYACYRLYRWYSASVCKRNVSLALFNKNDGKYGFAEVHGIDSTGEDVLGQIKKKLGENNEKGFLELGFDPKMRDSLVFCRHNMPDLSNFQSPCVEDWNIIHVKSGGECVSE